MNRFVAYLVSILLLLPISVVAVNSYRGKVVGGIDVVINRVAPGSAFDPSGIRAQMKTSVGDIFSQSDFDEDLKHLSGEFARVEPEIDVRGDQLFITLNLWPRPTIRSINWSGNQSIKTSKLQKQLGISPGSPFDRNDFATAFHKVKAYYTKKGYFEAELGYTICPDEDSGDVDIDIEVNEGRSGHIRQVKFIGFTKREELDLVSMMQTRKYFFLTAWLSGTGSYQDEAVEQDRFVVLNYLQNLGYADAKVDINIGGIPRGRGISVTFVADKGPLFHFGKIEVQGNTIFTTEEIEGQMAVHEGSPYSPERLRNTVKDITDLYGTKGYIEAVVTYEPHQVPDENVFDVTFNIQEGEEYRVGLIRVFGNTRTQENVILHETHLCPGEVFDIRRLQYTEQTLRNIGYFENVNVYAVNPHDELLVGDKYRDVYIELCEQGTGHVGLQFGYSTDNSAFTGIEITEKNFNYRGIPRMFRDGPGPLRGGGEYAKLKLNLGKKLTTITASWTKPYFNDTCWVIGGEIERSTNKRQAKDYTIENTGLSMHATYPLNSYLAFGWHYRVRYSLVDLKDPDKASEQLRREASNNGTISATGVRLSYDSTDFRHTHGVRSSLEGEYAGVFGDWTFLNFAYLNTYYKPLWHIGVMKLRADFRFIQPVWDESRKDIPLSERFFLGGETTVRGYAPYSLGPETNGDPLGGLSSVLVSMELSRKMAAPLDGFIFVDGGYISTDTWAIRSIRWSTGFGFRLNLAGQLPITFGWGFPLNPRDDNVDPALRTNKRRNVRPFFFSLGGTF